MVLEWSHWVLVLREAARAPEFGTIQEAQPQQLGIQPGIYHGIYRGIPPGIYRGIHRGIPPVIHRGIPPGIPPGIVCGIGILHVISVSQLI